MFGKWIGRCGAVTALFAAGGAAAVTVSAGGQASAFGGFESTEAVTDTETFNNLGTPTTCEARGGYDVTGFAARSGNAANVGLAPTSNASCYGHVFAGAPITIDWLATYGETATYVGFQWGSIDEYNMLQFEDSLGILIDLGAGLGVTATGEEVVDVLGVSLYSTQFVNFVFGPAERPARMRFSSDNFAFEFDNVSHTSSGFADIVIGPAARAVAPPVARVTVGEPASALIVGAALLALGLGLHPRRPRTSI